MQPMSIYTIRIDMYIPYVEHACILTSIEKLIIYHDCVLTDKVINI